MAKFKVGDKVRVRSDLKTGERYGCMYFTEFMKEHVGKVVTIEDWLGVSYKIKECANPHWTDEMFEGLADEAPEKKHNFKVGDRVRINEVGKDNWNIFEEKGVEFGTIIVCKGTGSIGVEFDTDFGGHDCFGKVKNGHGWWLDEEEIELVKEEHKEEPTPVVNVNVTVNLYENACWYCRKGGLVDLYLNGQLGICPSCGRVCNNTLPTPKKESVIIEFKPSEPKKPKENKPLTKAELDALPEGAKVFTVWHHDHVIRGGKADWCDPRTTWRIKRSGYFEWSGGVTSSNSRYALFYLEEPERPF